jgi:hypothetical protein
MVAKYRIVKPCAYALDGKGVQHRQAGAVVELSGVLAAKLGDVLEKVESEKLKNPVAVDKAIADAALDVALLKPLLKPEGDGK